MLASSKLPSRIARKRFNMMMFPNTTNEMKYSAEIHPVARMQLYITSFQLSPTSTWNIVTNAHRMLSKCARGTSLPA